MILTGRLIVLVGVAFALMRLGGLPSEAVVSVSAVIGAALGFASTRTIGNLVAGIFLLITRPFKVGDYIRVDNIEGIVNEVTLNYVKIITACGNMVSISTLNMLDKSVINYRLAESDAFCYPLRLSFDSSIPLPELEKTLEKVLTENVAGMPRKADPGNSRSHRRTEKKAKVTTYANQQIRARIWHSYLSQLMESLQAFFETHNQFSRQNPY
jgi:small-conductance mechanosensitive channel